MHAHQVDLPELGSLPASWGLGFERFDTPGGLVIGHDGGTIGQTSFLRIVPDAGVAVALFTNGGEDMSLYVDVVGTVLEALTDTRLPPLPKPPAEPPRIDGSRYLGTYSCDVAELTVTQDDDGRIWLSEVPKGISAELGDLPQHKELVRFRDDTLIALEPEHGTHRLHAFLGDDGSGRALFAHVGRAIRRA
jgi:hypothetical protein